MRRVSYPTTSGQAAREASPFRGTPQPLGVGIHGARRTLEAARVAAAAAREPAAQPLRASKEAPVPAVVTERPTDDRQRVVARELPGLTTSASACLLLRVCVTMRRLLAGA